VRFVTDITAAGNDEERAFVNDEKPEDNKSPR
jgi:hypothetical protein